MDSPAGLSETMPKVVATHGVAKIKAVNENNALVTIVRPMRWVAHEFDYAIRSADRVQICE